MKKSDFFILAGFLLFSLTSDKLSASNPHIQYRIQVQEAERLAKEKRAEKFAQKIDVLREGQFSFALNSPESLQSFLGENVDLDQLTFTWGLLNFSQGKWENALVAFDRSWPENFILGDYVAYFLGLSLLAGEKWGEALAWLDHLEIKYPESRFISSAIYHRAKIFMKQELLDRALDSWEELEEKYPDVFSPVEVAWQKSIIYRKKGEMLKARNLLLDAYLTAPEKKWLENLEGVFENWNDGSWKLPETQLELAERLADKRRFEEGWDHFQKIPRLAGAQETTYFLKGRLLYGLGRYEEALPILKELSEKGNHSSIRKESWSMAFSAMARLKRYDESMRWYEDKMRETRAREANPYWALVLAITAKRYEEGLKILQHPVWKNQISSRDQHWWEGWCYFRLGELERAKAAWKFLLRSSHDVYKLRAQFWVAQILTQQGNEEEAEDWYKKIIHESPTDYYSWLSLKALFNNPEEAKVYLQERGIGKQAAWSPENLSKPRSLYLRRCEELYYWGLFEEGKMEIRTWYREENLKRREAPVALFYSRKMGEPQVSLALARDYWGNTLERFPAEGSSSRFFWESAYPKGYENLVPEISADHQLDSYFVYALMRAESSFRQRVVSPMGAVGLMQIMPETGAMLSRSLGKNVEVEHLYQPEKNIELGTFYLKFLKSLFKDKMPYVIASYNAGEEAVVRWLSEKRETPVEIFIEEIPFLETRGYTRKVLMYYWNYLWLYEENLFPLYH